jgi:hypothetical protein
MAPVYARDHIDHLFTYHPPTGEEQLQKYQNLREAGKTLAKVIWDNCPPGADASAAIRKVREAVMTANAAIACDQPPEEDEKDADNRSE